MFTDTHCHILKEYYEDIDTVVREAEARGITKMIVNGTNLATNLEVLSLAQNYKAIYAAIGYHPEDLADFREEDLNEIEENIDKIVAIGEIGLDYHYEPCDRISQMKLFRRQLDIAQKYHKPVIVHSRDATEDTIKILKEYPEVTGSIHCFSGSIETARIYIEMGYKLGFGGVLTFKNAHLKDVLKKIPPSAILLETDSPYLSPEPVRGTANTPANISHIVDFISREISLSPKEISHITEKNVRDLFDI